MINMVGIVPQKHLELLKNDKYHMILAQLYDAPGMEQYTHFYKEEIKYYAYTILDNGAAEGQPMPIATLVDKAERLHASEIVLPDSYKNCKETLEWHTNAIEYLLGYYGCAENIPFNLMIVPQGTDETEWFMCAKALLSQYGDIIHTIGIPKHLVNTFGNRDARLGAIKMLHDNPEIELENYDIHLLGCWTTPLEILTIAKVAEQGDIPMVRSCDSALAYVYARNNKRFEDDDRPDQEPIDFRNGECDEEQLAINLKDWHNVGNLTTNNIFYL